MNSDRMTKPATPTRQPKPSLSICPIGADTNAPSDPAAETMPITVLRTVAGTARADTDIAIALAVQASDAPISTPRADQDRDHAVRGRHQGKADDVEQRAHDHDRPKTVAHRHRAGDRLQKSPGEILHRERQREMRTPKSRYPASAAA